MFLFHKHDNVKYELLKIFNSSMPLNKVINIFITTKETIGKYTFSNYTDKNKIIKLSFTAKYFF